MATDESTTLVKNPFLIIAASVLTSGVMASSCFLSRAESVVRTANGLLPGTASPIDAFIAGSYRMAGWLGADGARAFVVFLPCLLFLALIGFLARALSSRLLGTLFFIAILAALAWGVRETMKASKSDIRDLRLLAPIELFQAAAQSGGRVFVNPPAYAHAALLAPDLFARLPSLDLIAKMCAALPMWREEDRREPFSALIFTGNRLAEIRPLVESLSSDWYLARMDNHGLLYLRGNPSAKEVTVNPNSFTDPRSKAIFLSQSALVLDAMTRHTEARQMMQNSLEVFPEDSTVLVNSAMLAASQKRWPQTQKNAESALKLTPDSVQARYLLALALLETNSISQAATESTRLTRQRPLDPQILKLHARISKANNDFTAEINALERLLVLEKKANQATSPIHLYLGQAWARKGFAAQALSNYESALQGPLTPLQKSEIQAAIQNIRQKSGPTETAGH